VYRFARREDSDRHGRAGLDAVRSFRDLAALRTDTMKLLHIDSSILGEGSVSRQLTAKLVAAARARHGGVQVTYRDLVAHPVGHLTSAHLAAAQGATVDSAALRQDVKTGQSDLEAFLAADVVVVGTPMYNFGVPGVRRIGALPAGRLCSWGRVKPRQPTDPLARRRSRCQPKRPGRTVVSSLAPPR